MSGALLSGEIVFPAPPPSLAGATVYVRLQDTSLADGLARLIAEQVLTNLGDRAAASGSLPYFLHANIEDQRARLTVSVHVDLDGDGAISRGDYLSTTSIPVLTRGHPGWARVPVRRVD